MQKEELSKAVWRIDKELPNFKHIHNNLPYKSKEHQKAVEETSFELLENDISILRNVRKLRKKTDKILLLIKEKKTVELIGALEKYKIKISRLLEKKNRLGDIIILEPNFHGIGINMKALFKKRN